MKYRYIHTFVFALLFVCSAFAGKPKKKTIVVTVHINPVFNGHPLVLDTATYSNEHGDALTISLFRFYITRLKLHVKGTTSYVIDNYSHLIDAQETATCTFSFEVPEIAFDTISFIAGVDSADNTSGANGGDLDPAKGMYWAWKSGYIMAKLEGNSPVCKTIHKAFEFHIGGYMSPYNAMREITLPLASNLSDQKNDGFTISINADAAKWFTNGIGLAVTNSVLIPGKQACEIADNYSGMFSISASKP